MSLHPASIPTSVVLGSAVVMLALAGCGQASTVRVATAAAPVTISTPSPQTVASQAPAVRTESTEELEALAAKARAARKAVADQAAAAASAQASADAATAAEGVRAVQAARPRTQARSKAVKSLTADQRFLQELTAGTETDVLRRAEWVRLGRGICTAYSRGSSTAAVFYALRSLGLSPSTVVVVIGAALNNYCPQYWPRATSNGGGFSGGNGGTYSGGEENPQFNIGPIQGDTEYEVRCKAPDEDDIDVCTVP